jgi:hypothetical protein
MEFDWTKIIFYLLVIDSLGAVLMSWWGSAWWRRNLGTFSRFFPPARGWSLLYLVLVIVIGYLLGII